MKNILFFLILVLIGCKENEPNIKPVDEGCYECEFVITNIQKKSADTSIHSEFYYPCGYNDESIKGYESSNYIFWENLKEVREWKVKCTKI